MARGQEITWEFAIENPTGREARVLGSDPLTPCCSSVLEIPATIAAHSRGRMKVSLRPGFPSGREAVRFVVATDGGASVPSRFSLLANLFAEVDVEDRGGPEPEVDLGSPGTRRLRILCRRAETEGRDALDRLEVTPPATAGFVGPGREVALTSGIVESTREVVVRVPPSAELGRRSINLPARWADGREWNHSVACEVVAPLKVSPSGLVVRSSDAVATKAFLVNSSKAATFACSRSKARSP